MNEKGVSNNTLPSSFATSTAPGRNPKVLSSPGPISNTCALSSSSIIVWNSVPLEPIVPAAVLTSNFSGFFWLINPLKTFTLPSLSVAKKLPSNVLGSKTNSSIVIDVFSPI